ncbi:unnamed protein product [Closterium sp. NIES-65]|nr:unnamed protein product [Closterium sp. NIES-65]
MARDLVSLTHSGRGTANVSCSSHIVPHLRSPNLRSPTLGTPTLRSPTLGTPTLGSPTIGSPHFGSPHAAQRPPCLLPPCWAEYFYNKSGSCAQQTSFFAGQPVLSVGVGYAVVLGFGAFFAVFTSWLVWLDKRYVGTRQSSEWFNTAGRNVKTGLIASVIVSQWTWAATILQSSNVAFQNGVSGPFWYASGATVQVLLFGIIAVEIKRKAPNAHTVCEIVRARWGTAAHVCFLFFCFLTNTIVTAMLVLGGAAVVTALTGLNVYLASFLAPIGVIFYTLAGAMLVLGGAAVVTALTGLNVYLASFLAPIGVIFCTLAGGLKATFLASYIHSVIVHSILCTFRLLSVPPHLLFPPFSPPHQATFLASYIHSAIVHGILVTFVLLVYCFSGYLGSLAAVFNNLEFAASPTRDCRLTNPGQVCGPVDGNYEGSYLTMLSPGGFMFGIVNIVGNFGAVFLDNGYWMSAIASRPSSTHRGYILGGLVWFAVPFSLGTSLGLSSLALGLPVTLEEASRGLVPPAAAVALMGDAGAVLILVMVFMAVTSAGSAELLAVSSLMTYDIYRTYINPKATGRQILFYSRVFVLSYGLFMGVLAVGLSELRVSLGWMYLVMGVLIGSAVIPVTNLLLWKKANAVGAIAGCIIGMISGVVSWITVAVVMYGTVDLNSTGEEAPTLTGNLVSLFVGGIVHVALSLKYPDDYDYASTRAITLVDRDWHSDIPPWEHDETRLKQARHWIILWGVCLSVVLLALWPLLALPAGVFSLGYFTFWVVIAITWGVIASAVIIFLPVYENWRGLVLVIDGLFTSDILQEKVDDIGLRLAAIMATIPEAEARRFAFPIPLPISFLTIPLSSLSSIHLPLAFLLAFPLTSPLPSTLPFPLPFLPPPPQPELLPSQKPLLYKVLHYASSLPSHTPFQPLIQLTIHIHIVSHIQTKLACHCSFG